MAVNPPPGSKTRKQRRKEPPKARKVEIRYARLLRKLARNVGDIVNDYLKEHPQENPDGSEIIGLNPQALADIDRSLELYAQTITPWANAVGSRMIAEVAQKDEIDWAERSANLSRDLREEIASAPTGAIQRALLQDQVQLITSIPRDAAIRVHELAQEAMLQGSRGKEIVEMIMRSGTVAEHRAMTIARTEVSRTQATLTQARAEHVGSTGYIWRTAEDSKVRKEHKPLNGKFFTWDNPPVSGSKGEKAHAGCIYNCRCYAEVVIPDADLS